MHEVKANDGYSHDQEPEAKEDNEPLAEPSLAEQAALPTIKLLPIHLPALRIALPLPARSHVLQLAGAPFRAECGHGDKFDGTSRRLGVVLLRD